MADTTITCILHALLFVDNVITLIVNYVHINYFAITVYGERLKRTLRPTLFGG